MVNICVFYDHDNKEIHIRHDIRLKTVNGCIRRLRKEYPNRSIDTELLVYSRESILDLTRLKIDMKINFPDYEIVNIF